MIPSTQLSPLLSCRYNSQHTSIQRSIYLRIRLSYDISQMSTYLSSPNVLYVSLRRATRRMDSLVYPSPHCSAVAAIHFFGSSLRTPERPLYSRMISRWTIRIQNRKTRHAAVEMLVPALASNSYQVSLNHFLGSIQMDSRTSGLFSFDS